MSKKFYIGICCLALLATSVASGYSEDFEGYTGNVGDQWSGTPEFPASGWTTAYKTTSSRGDISNFDLSAGYNSAQGIVSVDVRSSGAHLLDAPQGPNSTFVYTAMMNCVGQAGMIIFGTDELLAPQAATDGWFGLTFWGGSVYLDAYINGGSYGEGWIAVPDNFYTLGWCEVKAEADTNASSRPTVVRAYYRDLADDGSGPTTGWTQVVFSGTGGGLDLFMGGADYKLEAIAVRGNGDEVYFDNLYATPEPVTLAILGAGGLLALLRRRR